jgi:hypothetical protein
VLGLMTSAPQPAAAFARGWRRGASSGPIGQWAIAALVIGVFALTTHDVQTRPLSNREYRGVAEGLAPRVRPGDVVVTRYDWYSAPLHYYLTPEHYKFIHLQDFPDEQGADVQRAWLIL